MLAVGCSRAGSTNSSGTSNSTGSEVAAKLIGKSAPPALTVGSPAPPLKVKKFLKGEPVTSIEPGKIYVVEFWATWCGPCIEAMPHVSELQAKYPKVTFIGVNVWEDDDTAAEGFLKARGQELNYRFARDDIPEGGSAYDGAMARTWLAPAEIGGIPTAMVVDAQGRIASISHPMDLEQILPQIISGKWDMEEAAKQHLLSVLPARNGREFNERLDALIKAGPSDETPAELDRLAEEFPEQAGLLGLIKFRVLALADDKADQALATGQSLLKSEFGKNPQMLNAMAWEIVAPERPKQAADKLKTFALDVAKKADSLVQKKNPAVADTLARAQFANGDVRGATETQRRAITLAKSNPRFANMVKELQKHLAEYNGEASKDTKLE